MGQQITMGWQCPACLVTNQQDCQKPSHLEPSVLGVTCKACTSKGMLRVNMDRHRQGFISYEFFDFKVSQSKINNTTKEEKT